MLRARPARPARPRRPRAARAVALAAGVVLLGTGLTACQDEGVVDNLSSETSPDGSGGAEGAGGVDGAGGSGADPASYAVEKPGPFTTKQTSDVLLTSPETLDEGTVEEIEGLDAVEAAVPLSWASVSVNGRTLDIAAVDATSFRNFMPIETAQADFVWDRLAGGEVVLDDQIDRKLVGKGDMFRLGSSDDSPQVHVGAYAPLNNPFDETRSFDVLVNTKRGEQLGIPSGNALLVSTGSTTPSELKKKFDAIVGDAATLKTLAVEFDVEQTAVLTGQSVSDAIGTFSYTDGPDGTVNPDPAWVKEYIRTETVPILGQVTCNKGMLPQLRGALSEIVRLGLADEINPDEYAGCYYPRYINRDPSYGLSLHSWGIAVDLNVPGNQRGTAGEMDRTVVAIFKRWGFAWGGDWSYTDPMHFEMDRVVR